MLAWSSISFSRMWGLGEKWKILGQGGEKGRPVNISFLSCYFFLQETSFLSSWVWSLWWVPVAVSACTVAAICKKSLTKHMTGVAAGPPLLLPSPWGPWGEPILPFGTGWVRGPTHRQSSQQSRFALLWEKQRHHTALPQRFWKTYTQLERIAWNCKRNGSDGKRKEERERVEGQIHKTLLVRDSPSRHVNICERIKTMP